MSTAYQINPSCMYAGRKPIRSAAYLKFVRALPCCACASTRSIEAAHCGPHGLAQKVSDTATLPLCRWCHRELHELGPVAFQEKYALDFSKQIAKLNRFFESTLRGTY